MRATTERAREQGCSHVILAGDLTDEKHGTRVEVLELVYRELQYAVGRGVTWVWLRGNHEIGIKSQPHITFMTLFQSVAHVIIEPAIWETPDSVLFFLPWYLAEEYRERARAMAATARTYSGKLRFLFSHIGIDEGKASPSNMYVEQAVEYKHLVPEAYDQVWLGDYHVRQQIGANVRYVGVPCSLKHGDDLDNGVWLIDTAAGSFQTLALGEKFPRHKTWDVVNPALSILAGYDPQDHNRIKIPREWIPTYQTLYPGAQFLSEGQAPDKTARRLTSVEHNTAPETIWRQFCEIKNWEEAARNMGLKILGEVAARRWETQK